MNWVDDEFAPSQVRVRSWHEVETLVMNILEKGEYPVPGYRLAQVISRLYKEDHELMIQMKGGQFIVSAPLHSLE